MNGNTDRQTGFGPEPEPEEVDVVVLTRDGGPPPGPVRSAIDRQAHADLLINTHVVAGASRPGDPNRWATIARARNAARRVGSAPWVMFVDDDVVLGPGCVALLVEGLKRRPGHAALAADYLGESDGGHRGGESPFSSPHVALGATLFRRDVLAFLPFRWEEDRCECRCCAHDLRRAGFAIDYLRGAEARHERALTRTRAPAPAAEPAPATEGVSIRAPGTAAAPRVLAAFNRAHFRKFLRVFLTTFRGSGNPETVTAYAYGLLPSEQHQLSSIPGLEPVFLPDDGVCPAISRLRDFAEAVARWPSETPVAYWDAADVVFQTQVAPLWEEVRAHPDRLLVASESFGILDNPKATEWVLTIDDPAAREYAFERFVASPYLNSGFAAGTARRMYRYFREADRLLHSPALRGSTDWGDQTALNLYCHTDPGRWREVDRGWNYTLCRMKRGGFRVTGTGRILSPDGTPVHVAHGNAKMLPHVELSHLYE